LLLRDDAQRHRLRRKRYTCPRGARNAAPPSYPDRPRMAKHHTKGHSEGTRVDAIIAVMSSLGRAPLEEHRDSGRPKRIY